MTTRAPAPVDVPVTVVTTGPLDRAPAPVSAATDPELPRTPVPVLRPAAVATPAPAPTPYTSTATPAVVLPIEEAPVDLTPPAESEDRNIIPSNTPRYVTVLQDGTVVVSEAAQLNFSGSGVSVVAQGSTANIVITAGGSSYANANVAAFLAAYGSNTIVTTGNITGGYLFGNGSQLTGITASTGNITFTDTTMSPPDGEDIIISAANSQVDIQAQDFRVETTDDVRITGSDTFSLRNLSNTEPVSIFTDYNGSAYGWEFNADGSLTAPGDIIVSGDVTGTSGASTLYLKAQPASNTYIQLNNSVDSVISTVANLEIVTDSSNTEQTWTFDNTGTLTFPDSSFIGDSVGFMLGARDDLIIRTDSADVQNDWFFGVDGTLTLPNGTVLKDTAGNAVSIGVNAGTNSQGNRAVAIGVDAGTTSQGVGGIAIGEQAGHTSQGVLSVAIGYYAGSNAQSFSAVAIGAQAGETAQGSGAIAIGDLAGRTNQANNSIILNATGANLDQTTANTFTVAPIRNDVANTGEVLFYNTTSKEITYGNTISVAGNVSAGNVVFSTGSVGENNEDGNLRIITTGNLRGVAAAAVEIVSAAGESEKTWTFATDGTLTAPGNITTPGGYLRLNSDLFTWGLEAGPDSLGAVDLTSATFDEAGNVTAQYTVSVINDGRLVLPESSEANVAKLTSPPNDANVSLQLYSGNAVRIVSNSAGEPFVWTFGTTGTLTAPGNIVSGNLSATNTTTDVVTFDTSAGISVGVGQMAWNSSDGTVDIGIGYGNVVLQTGQETHYIVRNDTGNTIENGTSVYCSGVTGGSGRIEASPFVADGSVSPVQFLGLATQDISDGVNGVVTYFGYVRGLDTRGTANTAISVGDEDWAVGDKLYAHPTAAGKLTKVEPAAPNSKICVCVVITRNQTTGVLFVRPTTNLRAVDLSDVQIATPAANDILTYTGNRWENQPFGLPVYADATARDAAITSPTAGMMVYVTGTGMQVRGATSWNTIAGSGT